MDVSVLPLRLGTEGLLLPQGFSLQSILPSSRQEHSAAPTPVLCFAVQWDLLLYGHELLELTRPGAQKQLLPSGPSYSRKR